MVIKQKIKFTTVDQYLTSLTPEKRAALEQLRQTIRKAAPKAEELISYQMPAFRFHGMLAFYAAHKNHYGLYVMSRVAAAFKDELAAYEVSKATIKFPLDKPIPKKLVTAIIKHGVKFNLDKMMLKEAAKAKKIKKK